MAIAVDPAGGIAERRRDELASPNASFLPHDGEAGPLEHPYVLGDGRQRDGEVARDLADGGVTTGELREDGATRAVGERAEGGIEGI